MTSGRRYSEVLSMIAKDLPRLRGSKMNKAVIKIAKTFHLGLDKDDVEDV